MDFASIIALIAGGASAIMAKFPVLATIALWMGVLRAVLKPIGSLVRAVTASVAVATGKPDSNIEDKIEASTVYKWLSYVLDYVASVKVGPQADPSQAK